MNNFLEEAIKIVLDGGKIAKNLPMDSRKLIPKGNDQFFTQGDLDVEKYVVSKLMERFPGHSFDSEEMGKGGSKSKYIWILDPIDGTSYYSRNVPFYSVSLALEHSKEPVLGIVYCPELDRMYYASKGNGTILNGRVVHCLGDTHIEKAYICLEIPSAYSNQDELQWALYKMSELIKQTCRVRIIGVGSLGLCFCASGGFDAYVNLGSMWKHHDVAAGEIIVREAGGEFLYVGEEKRHIIAGSKRLCVKIRDILKI